MTAPMDLHVTGSEVLAARLIVLIATDPDRRWWGHVTYRTSPSGYSGRQTVTGYLRSTRVDHGQGTAIEVVHADDPDDVGISDYTLVDLDDIISVTIPC